MGTIFRGKTYPVLELEDHYKTTQGRLLINRKRRRKIPKTQKKNQILEKTHFSDSSLMASRKIFHTKPNYIYPAGSVDGIPAMANSDGVFEFDEAEIWSSGKQTGDLERKKSIPTSREARKMGRKITPVMSPPAVTSASLPVNVPDWSKILKDDYKDHRKMESDDDDDDGGEGWLPPHEYLARNRGASLSVHEGIGRTLKGRDLRRVRNAIWKKVGFED